jgi:DNA mismatch repair protein MSH2
LLQSLLSIWDVQKVSRYGNSATFFVFTHLHGHPTQPVLPCLFSPPSFQSQTSSSKGKDKRFKEVSELLEKLSEVINSRTDIFQNERESTNIVETLPKHLSTATNLQSIDYSLAPLLGGDGDERYTAYKGDRTLANDPLTKRAIGLLLHVYNLESERGSSGSYELSAGHLTSHLFLDRTASEAINLLPPPKHSGISTIEVGGADSNNSIFGILNRCKTKMGARMLELWLRQPLIDLNHIMYRQNAVHHMVEVNSLGRDKLRNEGLANLAGLDMDGFVSKLAGTVDLDGNLVGGSSRVLEYLYRLHLFADKQLPALIQALSCLVNPSENSVDNEDLSMTDALKNSWVGLNSAWRVLSRSIQLVEAILDFDLAPRAFLVKTSFNMELSEIRQDLDTVDEELEQIHAEMDEMWSHVSGDAAGQVRLEATDSNTNTGSCSWQFRLPDTNAAKVLQDGELSDKVTVHRVLKNGVYFSTKALRQLGVRKQDLLSEYDKHQRTIVQNAAVVAVTYVPILEKVSTIIAELDVLSGLAHAAAFSTNTYCCPELSDDVQDGCGIEVITFIVASYFPLIM